MTGLNAHSLLIDVPPVKDAICSFIRAQVAELRRDGAVVGLSGGVDSALCASLCVEALGRENVTGLLLPERESHPSSLDYAIVESSRLGIRTETIDVSQACEAMRAYELRDSAIKTVFPEYNGHFKSKIVLPGSLLSNESLNYYTLVIDDGNGNTKSARLSASSLRRIIAATNVKQRIRMVYLYRFAETFNNLVCGTTNRTELIQGFFVKYGDGGVDIEPISGLYKTQVYQLARHVGVSQAILDRAPTPDTFSLGVTDEEFYFRVPYDRLDLLLYAWENRMSVKDVCRALELNQAQVERVFRDLSSKYKVTRHLRAIPPAPALGAAPAGQGGTGEIPWGGNSSH